MNIRKNIISLLLIVIGLSLPIVSKYDDCLNKYKENEKINNYINNSNIKNNYLLILEIPKIKLKKGIYPINSKDNDISKSIIILKESNIDNNTILLASHSGTNNNAYFNNIKKLIKKDIIYIYMNNKKYTYEVTDIYYIEKNGYLEINYNLENKLILITCSTIDNKKQLIVKSNLQEKNNIKA